MLNTVTLIGRLGHDPSAKSLPSGDRVVNVSLATTETWKDKSGNKQEKTTWFALAFWGRLGEIAEEYLRKGALVYIEGPVAVRAYMNKQGEAAGSLEVRVREMKMLGSKNSGSAPEADSGSPRAAKESAPAQEDFNDEIPF